MAVALSASVACGALPAAKLLETPTYAVPGQGKVGITQSAKKPLIVEWPSSERLSLEARAKHGVVVVRYAGRDMEVLNQCRAPGRYLYTATTMQSEGETIHDEAELYAKLPAYAVNFEAQLKRAGQLNVSMSLVGRYESNRQQVRMTELNGDCTGATHIVSAMIAGAFEFFAGAKAVVGGGVQVGGMAAVGGTSGALHDTLNKAGDADLCLGATNADLEPPDGCGALVRIEVVSILDAAGVATAPTALTEAPQPTNTIPPKPAALTEAPQPTNTVPPKTASNGSGFRTAGFVIAGTGVAAALSALIPWQGKKSTIAALAAERKGPQGVCVDSARCDSLAESIERDGTIMLGLAVGGAIVAVGGGGLIGYSFTNTNAGSVAVAASPWGVDFVATW